MNEKLRIGMFDATVIIGTKNSWNELHYCSINKCLLNKPKQRSIVKKDLIFTLNIPKIRCKTP